MKNSIKTLLCLCLLSMCIGSTHSNIDPQLVKMAMIAQHRAQQHYTVNNTNIMIVDFRLPSTSKRLWVIDKDGNVLLNTYVTHGSRSGEGVYATHFSNESNSLMSSIGVSLTTYVFYGKHGRSLKIEGLEPGYNSNEASRAVEIHGAEYIGNGHTGHSWGCFAVPYSVKDELVTLMQNHAVILAYYPDRNWLIHSHYIH